MFPGTHSIERAYDAWQIRANFTIRSDGDLVPDVGVDNGPLLNMRVVHIEDDDTLDSLKNGMHEVEHELLVETIHSVDCNGLERTIHNAKSNSFRT